MWQALKGLALVNEESDPSLWPRRIGVKVPRAAKRPKEAVDEALLTATLAVGVRGRLPRGPLE
eukprot:7264261-Alexandrium_andersonii.AAC.1